MQQELKKFDKVITVEVSVDMIASQLMKAMDNNNPHAALLVNTIIGSSLSTGKIGFIYNALNGWNDEINITIGKEYMVEGKFLDMYNAASGEKESSHIVTVTEIDEYRDGDKIAVSYSYMNNTNGGQKSSSCWVDHKALVEITTPEELQM